MSNFKCQISNKQSLRSSQKIAANLKQRFSDLESFFGNCKLEIKNWKFKNGFTFIELLVVISLMAIIGASVTAAYLGFEKRQRVKEAALIVKNEIRAMQNNATSGKDVNCVSGSKLLGWVFDADLGSGSLNYGIFCYDAASYAFVQSYYDASKKGIKLPQGVGLIDVKYGPLGGSSTSIGHLYIFHKALGLGYSFHSSLSLADANTGDLLNTIGIMPQDPVTIILGASGTTYGVVVKPSGEVYEVEM